MIDLVDHAAAGPVTDLVDHTAASPAIDVVDHTAPSVSEERPFLGVEFLEPEQFEFVRLEFLCQWSFWR